MISGATGESGSEAPVLGAVLAGGLGRRLGGPKATVRLNRQPLITYPLRALAGALDEMVVVAKLDSDLPPLPGVPIWFEPAEPRHPLAGLVQALRLAQGRPVLVCPCDLPFVTPELVGELAGADSEGTPAVIAQAGGRLQPLLGCYQPAALGPLSAALRSGPGRLRKIVAELEPRLHDVPDPGVLFNVNTPEDLLRAGSLLAARQRSASGAGASDQPNVKS